MSGTPSLPGMPQEIIQNIFLNLPDIQSVLNLAQTSKQFYDALDSPQYEGSKKKLEILQAVVERQFSPMPELFQLATLMSTEIPGIPRAVPPLSLSFVKSLVFYGTTVEKWADLYPQIRWRENWHAEYRRELRPHERERLRRAMYRWWIYSKAFHSIPFINSPAGADYPLAMEDDVRLYYMRQFSEEEIIELCEVVDTVRDMINVEICPDHSTIQQSYRQAFPGQPPLYFGSYETHPDHPGPHVKKQSIRDLMVAESWGSTMTRDLYVKDIMKLTPDKLLHFCTNLYNKSQRVAYVQTMQKTFHSRPATFRDALDAITAERDFIVLEDHGVDGGIIDDLEEDTSEVEENSDEYDSSEGKDNSVEETDNSSDDANVDADAQDEGDKKAASY